MPWISDRPFTWIEQIAINVIKAGNVPKHVAFIMDGNRRYAAQTNISIADSHRKGFAKMIETMKWCRELGINEVSVYAFAVANFNRSKEEVNRLMELAKETLHEFLDSEDQIIKAGLRVKVMGNLSYLSPEIRKLLAKVEFMSENNSNLILNFGVAYSSRDEITNAIKTITGGVNTGLLEPQDINEQLISDCMFINNCPDPDMLIRTSGEIRLSDFMLWQTTCTQIFFTSKDILWPKLSIWHFLGLIFKYQSNYNYMLSVKKTKASLKDQSTQNNQRVAKFLEHFQQCRRKEFESYITVQ